MDEPTCKPAFNNAAPKAVANIKREVKYKRKPARHSVAKSKPNESSSSVISLKPKAYTGAPVMTLDVEKYLHQFKDFVMTEEEKIEILNHLWNIMCRFVELGFGMDSHTLACEQKEKKPRIKDGILVNLDNPKDT